MRLHKIILQLSSSDFTNLSIQLKENKADKFLLLLNHYRIEKTPDEELLAILDVKQAAYYTLKSRLFDKIQEFLFKNTTDTRVELLQNVANIEHLIYETQRETAIGILKKLESELLEHDMPNELISVYKALKKLHIHTGKYYEYLQLYNKHVAYNLAQDKAEEILSLFSKTLGEYYLSRNTDTFTLLILYKKEIVNVCRLNKSHHLQLNKNILFTHFALFCPDENEMKDDPSIEEMLADSISIIDSHPSDQTYKYLRQIVNFLYFEYYHQLKLNKNAGKYFDIITASGGDLLLFNHCSFVYHFLISKIEYYKIEKKENLLINEEEFTNHGPNIEDLSSFVIFNYYKAAAEYYAGNHLQAIRILNNLINEVSFKNYPFAEMEIKSFLALLNIIADRFDQAEIIIRSVSRKIADEDNDVMYSIPLSFMKLLKTAISTKSANKFEKIKEQYQFFDSTNNGKYAFLRSLKLDEKTLQFLAK
ncbi:MAG: hypothetical protein NTX97_08715 [Bacteroidetes bacterium]|nr:hypothetical protein [Bacteroidota bacterium]